LSSLANHKQKPIIIGLGYDFQILSEDIAEPHDLRYQRVFTQSRILSYN